MGLTDDAARHVPGESRTAAIALLMHGALLLLSGLAFATFLAPPYPEWLTTPENQRFASFMFTFGGQTTVVLGAIAGLWHAAARLGWRTALAIFVVGFTIAFASEFAGTSTGYPFGPYSYTTQLGYLIGGRVPFNIPTSWFFMLYASLAICGRLLSAADTGANKWKWAVVAALVLTAWDVSMDPAMVATTHWIWHLRPQDGSTIQRIFLSDIFYGMPLTNWLGWLLTGLVVSRALLAIVPPSRWARDVSPTTLPLWLYGVNGTLPVLICIGRGFWWAVVLGTAAMALPLWLAVRAGRGAGAHAPLGQERAAPIRGAVAGD